MRLVNFVGISLLFGLGISHATTLQEEALAAYKALIVADFTAGAYVRPFPVDKAPSGKALGEFVAVRCYSSQDDIKQRGRFEIVEDLGRQAFIARKGAVTNLTNIYFFVPSQDLNPACANLFGGRATSMAAFGE